MKEFIIKDSVEGIICNICKQWKPKEDFPKSKRLSIGYRHECKECRNQQKQEWSKTEVGVIQTLYDSQKLSCKKREMDMPTYSKQEFKEWILSQPNWKSLYKNWVDNNYDRWEKPSVDRLSNYKSYTISNIRLNTWKENRKEYSNNMENGDGIFEYSPVVQLSMSGKFIKEWYSINEAARNINQAHHSNIWKVCNKERTICAGYNWMYVEDYKKLKETNNEN